VDTLQATLPPKGNLQDVVCNVTMHHGGPIYSLRALSFIAPIAASCRIALLNAAKSHCSIAHFESPPYASKMARKRGSCPQIPPRALFYLRDTLWVLGGRIWGIKLDEASAICLVHIVGKPIICHIFSLALVPSTYDTSTIRESCGLQIRCPKKRSQQLRQLVFSENWQQWEVSSKRPSTSLLWITDKRPTNSSISVVPLQVIETHAKSHLVLHSLYQSGELMLPLPQNARTATTILREAKYQLLSNCPELWRHYKPIPDQDNSLDSLVEQFASLLDAYSDLEAVKGRTKIYWLIDRIDTIFWRTHNAPNRLCEGPPQLNVLSKPECKAEYRQVARSSVTLDDFLERLNVISRRPNEKTEESQTRSERKWEHKVLVSSHYEVEALKRSHGSEDEATWAPGKWTDLVVR
jgi:hypothetical protein